MSETRRNKLIAAIGAFMFISPNLNLIESVFIYCGIRDHDIVRIIALIIYAVIDVSLVALFLKKKPTKIAFFILIIFNLIYILPLMVHPEKITILQYLMFIVPITLFSLMLSEDDTIKELFFRYFKYAAIVLFFIAIVYIALQTVSTERERNGVDLIHNMSYGDMGYLFLNGFLASVIYCKEKKYFIGLLGMIVFSLGVFFSGTRSAVICILFVIVLWIALALLNKKTSKSEKRLLLVGISVIILTLVVGVVTIPSGSRLNFFKIDFTDPNFSLKSIIFETEQDNINDIMVIYTPTNEERPISEIYEEEIIKSDRTKSETQNLLREDVSENRNEYIKLINEEDREFAENYKIINHRTFLWHVAIEEYKKHPVIGNGARYYMLKYNGFFPHNIILEALVDFGVIGALLVIMIGLYCFIRAVRYYLKTNDDNCFLLIILLFSHVPRYLLYTSLYSNYTIAMTIIIFTTMGKFEDGEKALFKK